jgi:hypothetical protein
MKPPIFVRKLSKEERANGWKVGCAPKTLSPRADHRSFWPAPAAGPAPRIARSLGCSSQTVRDDAIHAFNERGLDALVAASSRPERTNAAFDEKGADEAVREMLHRSPRGFGRDTSLRTLETAAQVSFGEGLVRRRLSGETIRATLARLLGVRWQRAKRWITSPDPLYQRKKGGATGSDGSGRGRPSVGSRLRGGVLVESAGFAHFE